MKKYDIAITVGVFDMLHQGHIDLIKFMRKRASKTMAFVHDDFSTFDNKDKFPVQHIEHRLKNLQRFVDDIYTVRNSNPTSELMEIVNFYFQRGDKIVYIRGDDWKDFPGKNFIDIKKIPIIYKKYTEGVSSTKIREQL